MADVRLTIWGIDKASATFRKLRKVGASAFNKIKSAAKSLKNALFSVKGAIAGLGVGLLAKSFVNAASTSENFKVRLKVLLGSVEEGNRLFKNMQNVAKGVSFEYEDIMRSATDLAGVMEDGVDEVTKWMPLILDISAATGISVQDTTSQIIRMYSAGAASADMFRERGVLAMLGFQAGVSYSAEETRRRLFNSWEATDSKFKDASKELSNTWDGLMSFFKDRWFEFRNKVMDSGPFERLKNAAKALLGYIDENADKVSQFAEDMGKAVLNASEKILIGSARIIDKVISLAERAKEPVMTLWNTFRSLPDWIQGVGLVGAFIGGKKGAIVLAGALRLVEAGKNIVEAFKQINKGNMSFKEFASSNYEELKAKLDKLREQGLIPVKEETKKAADNLKEIGNIDMGSAEESVRGFIDALKKIESASKNTKEITESIPLSYENIKNQFIAMNRELAKEKNITVDNNEAIREITEVVEKINSIPNKIAIKVIVESKIKASPERPFTEGIAYMKDQLSSLSDSAAFTLNMSSFTGVLDLYFRVAEKMSSLVNPYSPRHPAFSQAGAILMQKRAQFYPLRNLLKNVTQSYSNQINAQFTFNGSPRENAREVDLILAKMAKTGRSEYARATA